MNLILESTRMLTVSLLLSTAVDIQMLMHLWERYHCVGKMATKTKAEARIESIIQQKRENWQYIIWFVEITTMVPMGISSQNYHLISPLILIKLAWSYSLFIWSLRVNLLTMAHGFKTIFPSLSKGRK